MVIDIIAVIPELMTSFFEHSILKRGADKGLLEVNLIPLRPYGLGKSKQIDDYSYGGEAGMILRPEPLANCIDELKLKNVYDEIIYLTPDGETFAQPLANRLSLYNRLLLICGHYKGIDQRIRDLYVTREISIGDYVLTGGEIAAIVLVDAIGRLIPGVMSDGASALTDSHQDGLLAPPVYTRPAEFMGLKVPEVLQSGHEARIQAWRDEQSTVKTNQRNTTKIEK